VCGDFQLHCQNLVHFRIRAVNLTPLIDISDFSLNKHIKAHIYYEEMAYNKLGVDNILLWKISHRVSIVIKDL
jgi:hypothetical protein